MENMEQESAVNPTPKQSGGIGPIIGIVIIVVLLAIGGFYYFTSGVDKLKSEEQAAGITADEEDKLRQQGTSTDLADIEADLNATDLTGLDSASADFEAELNAQ
ncbi:MAG: hypothetical protein AAB439_00345 [Patescibacteria group bacterium]